MKLLEKLKNIVIEKISKKLSVSLRDKIVCEQILTPPLIDSKTKSYMGALYGASSNSIMSAFLRHPNFSKKIKNLYFCGGSVHPGGGIPFAYFQLKLSQTLFQMDK